MSDKMEPTFFTQKEEGIYFSDLKTQGELSFLGMRISSTLVIADAFSESLLFKNSKNSSIKRIKIEGSNLQVMYLRRNRLIPVISTTPFISYLLGLYNSQTKEFQGIEVNENIEEDRCRFIREMRR